MPMTAQAAITIGISQASVPVGYGPSAAENFAASSSDRAGAGFADGLHALLAANPGAISSSAAPSNVNGQTAAASNPALFLHRSIKGATAPPKLLQLFPLKFVVSTAGTKAGKSSPTRADSDPAIQEAGAKRIDAGNVGEPAPIAPVVPLIVPDPMLSSRPAPPPPHGEALPLRPNELLPPGAKDPAAVLPSLGVAANARNPAQSELLPIAGAPLPASKPAQSIHAQSEFTSSDAASLQQGAVSGHLGRTAPESAPNLPPVAATGHESDAPYGPSPDSVTNASTLPRIAAGSGRSSRSTPRVSPSSTNDAATIQPSQSLAAASIPMRDTGIFDRRSVLAAPPQSPNNGPVEQQDTFASLDAAVASPRTTWIQAGAHHAEAGYLDPSLGWVSVRADETGAGVHATLMPGSPEAAAALSDHLAGLNAFMADRQGHSATIALEAPDYGSTHSGGAQHQSTMGGQTNQQQHQERDQPVPDAHTIHSIQHASDRDNLASRLAPTATLSAAWAPTETGVHLSVMA